MKNEKALFEVRCNKCEWQGYEDDLKIISIKLPENHIDNFEHFKGCPECKTDAYLADIED